MDGVKGDGVACACLRLTPSAQPSFVPPWVVIAAKLLAPVKVDPVPPVELKLTVADGC